MYKYLKRRAVDSASTVIVWLILISGAASPARAQVVELKFDTLPSAQGFTYATNGPAESSIFSIDGTTLHQNSIGTGIGFQYYILNNTVDPTKPFTLNVRSRVLQSETFNLGGFSQGGFSFGVFTGSEIFEIFMDTSTIDDAFGSPIGASTDTTVFHDYRLEGTPGVGYQFFVDGSLVAIGPPKSLNVPNQIFIGDGTSTGNAKADITFYRFSQNDRLLMLFQGINTSLTCTAHACGDPARTCTGSTDFSTLLNNLDPGIEVSYYSYNGGTVSSDGKWCPNSYNKSDTAHSFHTSFSFLNGAILQLTGASANRELYFIGHSQGGLIAFQSLGMIGSLRNDAKIRLIATLDSPLGGTPAIHTKVAQLLTPWGNPAAGQLKQLYSTALHDRQQGTNAALACSIFGGCPDFPVPVTNRQAVDASTLLDPEKQPTIVNIGADGDDAVYHPQICKVLLPPVIAAGDNSGSQWVDPIGAPTHIVIHPPMNGAKPQPLIPLISMQQFHLALIGVPGVLDPFIPVCIGNSHAEVLKRYGGFLAACVNDSSCP